VFLFSRPLVDPDCFVASLRREEILDELLQFNPTYEVSVRFSSAENLHSVVAEKKEEKKEFNLKESIQSYKR